jgi:hypothetical protein
VHGNIERHNVGGTHCLFLQGLARQIEARDFGATPTQPGGWRSQPKGLVAKLISRNQDNLQKIT